MKTSAPACAHSKWALYFSRFSYWTASGPGALHGRGGRKNARQQAIALLTQVGLDQRMHHYPRQMSGGEQQRVAIARAFAAEPKILFADEPTGNLDSQAGERITDLLFDLNYQQGTTLVLVTHDERLAERCARHIRLEAGHITERR